MLKHKIAVSHAGGVLAEAVLECMRGQQVPADILVVLDTEEQRGTRIAYGDTYLITENQESFDYSDCGLLLLLEADQEIEQAASSQGCFILGNSSGDNSALAYMGEVIAEPDISYGADSVRLPSAEACCVLDTLLCLNQAQSIERINLTWLQSASHQGKAGIDELASQTINLLNSREVKPAVFSDQVAFNLISTEPDPALTADLTSMLDLSPGSVSQNAMAAAVFYGLAVAVTVRFRDEANLDSLRTSLNRLNDVEVRTEGGSVVSDCNQSFSCILSQFSMVPADTRTLCFWLMADPHRYGLARNYASLSGFLQNSFL